MEAASQNIDVFGHRVSDAGSVGRRTSFSEVYDDEDAAEKEKQKALFAERRKQHYNEMDLVRKMMAAKAAMLDEDEDEEDEDAEDRDGIGDSNTSETSIAAQEVHVRNEGQWAFGPADLHGGPKLPPKLAHQDADFRPSISDGSFDEALAGSSCEHANTSSLSTAVESTTMMPLAARGGLKKPGGARKPGLTWDEATIAEHDLERGTRQKIEEPNTPWIGSPQMSNEGSPALGCTPEEADHQGDVASPLLEEKDLHKKLHCWYRNERHRPSIQERWEISQKNMEKARTSQERRPSFDEMRKQHYGEMGLVHKTILAAPAEAETSFVPDTKFESNEADEEKERKAKAEFAMKRKQHYNEMDLVRKAMAAKMAAEEDDDEDEDD